MHTVKTQVDDATIEKINRSGKTKYQFLKEAVELKLKNDEALSIEATVEDLIEKKFKQMEQRTKQINQDLVEQSFGAVLDVFQGIKEEIAGYEKKHEVFRERLNPILKDILNNIAKK